MMVRAAATALLVCASIALPAFAAAPSSAADAAMRKTITDSALAWSRGDLDAFMESYEHAPDIAFVTSTGVLRGWEPMRERYRKTYGEGKALGRLGFSGLETTALGQDYGIVYGRFHLMRPGASKEATGVFDLVMHKTAKGWRIVSDHTS